MECQRCRVGRLLPCALFRENKPDGISARFLVDVHFPKPDLEHILQDC